MKLTSLAPIGWLCLLLPGLLTTCQPPDRARDLIDQAIRAHGGDAWQQRQISFDFRQYHLILAHQNGQFHYERSYRDSTGTLVREVLTNRSFRRTLNNRLQLLDTAQAGRYSRAVNAVAYFVLLPFKLRDPAVQADYAGQITLDGQRYDKIRVRFRAEGGGQDHGDTFFYWFNQRTHTLDFLAYSEGGPRFRKAINPRVVGASGSRITSTTGATTPTPRRWGSTTAATPPGNSPSYRASSRRTFRSFPCPDLLT